MTLEPRVRDLVVSLYARTGRWCGTARAIFGDAVPAAISGDAEAQRARHLEAEKRAAPCTCSGCTPRALIATEARPGERACALPWCFARAVVDVCGEPRCDEHRTLVRGVGYVVTSSRWPVEGRAFGAVRVFRRTDGLYVIFDPRLPLGEDAGAFTDPEEACRRARELDPDLTHVDEAAQ